MPAKERQGGSKSNTRAKLGREAASSLQPRDAVTGVAAVDRAMSILAAFTRQHAALTLTQLSEETGLYKSTVLRLAASLERFGFITRSTDGVFTLGSEPIRLAAICQSSLHPAETVMPVLRALAETTSESAALYVRSGAKRLCAYRVRSPRAVSDNVSQGDLLPLDRGAGGHVIMAFEGASGAVCDEVRRSMVSITHGERDRETAAIACPVFGINQELEGALSLSGPIHRFTPDAERAMQRALLDAAKKLTAAFGGDPTLFPDTISRKRRA